MEADGYFPSVRGRDGAPPVMLIGLIGHVRLVGGLAARFIADVTSSAFTLVYVPPVWLTAALGIIGSVSEASLDLLFVASRRDG